MYNPENQYRCTIIRGKAQKDLDNLLPAYANFINDVCPTDKTNFDDSFNNYLSSIFYESDFIDLSKKNQKTIRNHITEIAGKLFGLFFMKDDTVYESESCAKLVEDNDQPAFFKNLCLNFQFPNGTQKIQTIQERIANQIKLKPFHFILSLLKQAKIKSVIITNDEIEYYVLNSKEVLQGKINTEYVLNTIIERRKKGIVKKVERGTRHRQHLREQINLLELSNLIRVEDENVLLNSYEHIAIELFIKTVDKPLNFDIYKYDFSNSEEKKVMYEDWAKYFGGVNISDYNLLTTSVEALQQKEDIQIETKPKKGVDHTILGDAGEEYVYQIEKERVNSYNPRLTNKVIMLGKQRGIGYDISSVEANENIEDPEFARFIEVKSTKRTTAPSLTDKTWVDTINLTRKEWVAAKQYRSAFNIYRVYFTPSETVIRKINNPFEKNESGIINVLPTMYRMDFFSKSIDKQY
ncbi:MAG TPA: hypothetical protein DCX01_01280 [Bacteroidetes bacterium]|nr:hypothetical protein [Bacteroidota bacterium]